jgi:Uma2 family endonuclease
MASRGKLMTADELLCLSEDRQWYELVRGELRTLPLPGEEHAWLAANVTVLLFDYVRANRLGRVYGRVGCMLERDPDTVRAPDVAFIRQDRLAERPRPGYWEGAPDLVVEVISPNDRYTEVDEKIAAWLDHGARMVLAVNPRRRTVLVHRPGQPPRLLTEDDTLDGADVVPGWQLPVREIFSE